MDIVLSLHIFSVVLWFGSLLAIASLMGAAAGENEAARPQAIKLAGRLMSTGATIGAAAAIGFGILLVLIEPKVLRHSWLHFKLLLVLFAIFFHVRFYRRIQALEKEPGALTRREFMVAHGVASLLLLAIVLLAVAKPFN